MEERTAEIVDNWDKTKTKVHEEAVKRDLGLLAFIQALGFGHRDGLEENAVDIVEDILRVPAWISPRSKNELPF